MICTQHHQHYPHHLVLIGSEAVTGLTIPRGGGRRLYIALVYVTTTQTPIPAAGPCFVTLDPLHCA